MYINEINIKRYKVLEDIKIKLKVPDKDSNIVNLIAGTNGSGKTSLIQLILNAFSGSLSRDELKDSNFSINFLDDYFLQNGVDSNGAYYVAVQNHPEAKHISDLRRFFENNNSYIKEENKNTSPRIISVPNNISNQYNASSKLDIKYSFINKINPSQILGNAELYIKEYVITKERHSNIADPNDRTKEAIASFNSIFKDSDLITKLCDLDASDNHRPIFETINKDKIKIDKLSDGEKQLYGRVVSLMLLNPHNSIILIDEPEMSLHPIWQYAIMDIYKQIGKNNQFIIATHSPYIIAKSHYNELVVLKRKGNKITSEIFDEPPVSRDINNILMEIMGAECLPLEIQFLQKKYRKLVEEGKKESDEGKKLKQKLLDRESENSEFMQSIAIYEDLNF